MSNIVGIDLNVDDNYLNEAVKKCCNDRDCRKFR